MEAVYARHASLQDFEEFWRDHYDWLKDRGYLLRPRGLRRLLYPTKLRSDPRNHCVPIYEALEGPKTETQRNIIAVMPFLARWDDAEFNTVGEVIDFCKQMFEGLQFMHNLNIAHNDAKDTNIMMDWSPIYDIPPHGINVAMNANWSGLAKPHSRTTHPVKYYFIDWNLSGHYDPSLGTPMLRPGYGGDQSWMFIVWEMSFEEDLYLVGSKLGFHRGETLSFCKT
ncbi:hypothetical protein LENED_006433 [Lentinula edodes]|uniref:Protein kinase domain-containing protein n=1 Tax=Lentinula edodes TaxID=5353 RepID=A0A1Q3EBP5_LENED|nr:hypothetical protein LENED_006433 [Lentinula edodes]